MHEVMVIVRFDHGAVGLTGWGLFIIILFLFAVGRD